MNCKETVTYEKLESFIKSVFKKLPSKFTLTYRDSDDDVISLLNDGDVKILGESGLQKVRVEIREVSEDFYDQTQEILIEEESKNKVEAKVEPVKESEESRFEAQSCSDFKSLDESISEKLSKMMPSIISKVKEEVMEENKMRESQVSISAQNSQAVHPRYVCDGCEASPIIGARFKCAVCANFDLC